MNINASTSHPEPAERDRYESVSCPSCGAETCRELTFAVDDLTGKPGRFRFVTCEHCGLAYQNPRLRLEHIKEFYGDDYIAHRKQNIGGWFTPCLRWLLDGVERRKVRLARGYANVHASTRVLDVGCGSGGFLDQLRTRYGARTVGLDFKDLSDLPAMAGSEFHCGLFYEQDFGADRFDLVTMWHFLEHDYDPARSLATARGLLADDGLLIVEVPRLDSRSRQWFQDRWPGLQAPQHTVLFSRQSLVAMAERAGLRVVAHLPYGAFPAYFYLFTGVAFKFLRGRGLNLRRVLIPYLLGQVLLWPVMRFERHLNLAMQTIICRREP